jgi:hypothetical protein
MPNVRIDYEHLLDNEIKGFENMDDVAELCYPTGCIDVSKREILTKLCEIEFRMTGTWTHEFLDDLDKSYRYMNAIELANVLCDKLQEIYDWDEEVYQRLLG